MNEADHIVLAFVTQWVNVLKARDILCIQASTFKVFESFCSQNTNSVSSVQDVPDGKKYDLIFGDFPLGVRTYTQQFGEKKARFQESWHDILQALSHLRENGKAVFLTEPLGFNRSKGDEFQNLVQAQGFYISALFNAPENILRPHVSFRPIFVMMSRKPSDQVFAAELQGEEQAEKVVLNCFQNRNHNDLVLGLEMPLEEYRGFQPLKAKQQIARLETQYKSFEARSISALATSIVSVRSGEKLEEQPNSIYIPKIGNSPVISSLDQAKLKHHNYFQVILNSTVINDYVKFFFRSALGKMILESSTSTTIIPHLNKKDLEQVDVAIPSLEEQQEVVSTQHKLADLQVSIKSFESELALNPTSSHSITGQLDQILLAINKLSEADKIKAIIREGETKQVEFKESFSLDTRDKTEQGKRKDLELASLKTVAAFLNSSGGMLLIGVSDEGEIGGLESELKKFYKSSIDGFLLHWKNQLKQRIGEQFYHYIDPRVVKVDEKPVLAVECNPSKTACYIDNKDFYVRTNPATDKLDGPKLVEYVRSRFDVG